MKLCREIEDALELLLSGSERLHGLRTGKLTAVRSDCDTLKSRYVRLSIELTQAGALSLMNAYLWA